MGEGERAERAEPLAEVDWADVFARAVALGRRFLPEQDVDDVVTEGITRLYEGSATYDPRIDGELAMRVLEVGKPVIRAELRKMGRRESEAFEAEVRFEARRDAPPGPEQSLDEAVLRKEKAEVLRLLRVDCAGDDGALAVIDCAMRSIERPEDQARITGLSYENVRSAIKRVKRRLERLRKGEGTVLADE
jgi:DNA-directed RNA polymerase specialized sigma24 family protein